MGNITTRGRICPSPRAGNFTGASHDHLCNRLQLKTTQASSLVTAISEIEAGAS